jgi:uncharacterized protein YdhG (YjbR/CyaY superfamily)
MMRPMKKPLKKTTLKKTTLKKTSATKTSATRPAASWRAVNAESVDEYLAALPDDMRTALANLRTLIKAAAPTAAEGISYQVPVFKLNGKPLVGFGAATAHCSFFVMSTTDAMRARLAKLTSYEVGGGSIRFPANKPLPAALVTRLVKARIAEVDLR